MFALAAAGSAHAQATGPVSLDPSNAHLGTALVLGIDQPQGAIRVTLPRGTRFDSTAAARGAQVGFGRYVMDVQGFLPGGAGSTQLVWSLAATLGSAGRMTVTGTLLGAASVVALLQPSLDAAIPGTTTTAARFVRTGGRLEFRLAALPAQLAPALPATATPARLELSLSANRQARRTIYHRVKVPTATGGFRIRRIRDHVLVSHDLLSTPPRCASSWAYALRDGARSSTGAIPCLAPLT